MQFPPEYLFISLTMGLISYYLAKRRGFKKPFFYLIIGFFFGILGIAFIFMGPKPKQDKKMLSKKDIFEARVTAFFAEKHPESLWYYLDESMQEKGPVSAFLLKEKIKTGQITSSSYLWTDALDDWKSIETLLS